MCAAGAANVNPFTLSIKSWNFPIPLLVPNPIAALPLFSGFRQSRCPLLLGFGYAAAFFRRSFFMIVR
jgi:hypothetical protein